MDKIIIENLRARCIIGVFPKERKHKQDVVLNITLFTSIKQAAKTDKLDDAIDYKSLRDDILERVENSSFNLIEKLAEEVASLCLKDARVEQVGVKVNKPGALTFADNVAVEILRPERP